MNEGKKNSLVSFSFLNFAAFMSSKITNWLLFITLCLIWGSSFILMKWGLYDENLLPVLSA